MIRFAVIGTNWITDSFIEAASLHKDFQLVAVYSRDKERANQFASKYNVDTTFTDLHELGKSTLVDAVYIASPNSFHAEQACLLMGYGKHILCEKPLASNVREVSMMVEMAKKQNVLLMEALKTTLLPNFKVIRDNLHKIGKIRRYVASYCQYSSRYDAFKEGNILNAFDPTFSNGSIMDIGIYCIYPCIVLFGEPENILASGYKLSTGVDGEGTLLLTYKEMEGVAMHSKISNSYFPSEIQGEKGSIIIDKIHTPEHVQIRYRDGSIEDITVPQRQQSMYYEVEEFLHLLKTGRKESTINSYEHSLLTAKVIERARKQIGIVYKADKQ
ncbi:MULTISPECIES: Gfo/Idh/MocA family protein [Sutcliffiella]|uniref:Gfo/Idh/MocA family protein n=1 Tax=Sutcliffiella TaxID=2837511 RepID=UPI0022DE1BD9|nr:MULTISPECIES: Gfo/Idh/MocA family oxidoreductase [Sutcliffiella]MED4016754.1 Gfo/Idh/MocA family oxidoreductase [Sutcliffiella cohnii]WBL14276.1 Gfo/Idh/MocA family oxidoreductase [Sutcliffiella sp. NC1]